MLPSPCVLVIDDDESIRELVSEVLNEEGYGVVAVADAEAGIAAAQQTPPKLILLDSQVRYAAMPDSFVGAYRRSPGPHAPIYLFTATNNAASLAQRLGLAGVFAKPFDVDALVSLAEQHGCVKGDA